MAGLTAAWRLSEPGWRDELRVDHGVPARLAARRQGGQQPRAERPDRGARPAPVAGLLRERLPPPARVLRRARPPAHRSGGAHPDLARRDLPRRHGGARGPPRGRLAPLARPVHAERPAPGRARRHEARAHARRRPAPRAPADRGLPRLAARRRDRVGRGVPHRLRRGARRPEPARHGVRVTRAGRHPRGGDPSCGARSTAPAWRPRCGRSTGRSPRRARRSRAWSRATPTCAARGTSSRS